MCCLCMTVASPFGVSGASVFLQLRLLLIARDGSVVQSFISFFLMFPGAVIVKVKYHEGDM